MATEVAYFNSEYPSLSHTFIEREVQSVRAHGVSVRTFSVRRPGHLGRMGSAHEAALRETEYVLGSAWGFLGAGISAFLASPAGFVRSHWAAQRVTPAGLKERVFHAAYVIEAARLARMLRRRGVTHLHVHMANNAAMVAHLACLYDRRLSYSLTIHGSAEFFDVYRHRLATKAEGASFVRCISNFCRAQVMAWTAPSSWGRYHVVHTGVDTTRYAPFPKRPQDCLRMLTVGRMVAIKGYEVLLEACAALSRAGVEWRLDMVGEGPNRSALESKSRELGIADRVTFSGAVSQDAILPHFAEANVMVISSFMEGVPVVLMEAMSTGMAIVSTRVGGIPELVAEGVSGLLVDAGSVDGLRDALRRVAGDAPLREALGRAGREAVVRDFDLANSGAAMAKLFAASIV